MEMKKLIALILSAVLCLSLGACGSSKVEGRGYKSPEDALLAYADALKAGDVSKILSTFAVETYVENYNLEEYLNLTHVYNIGTGVLENDTPFARDLNLSRRQSGIVSNLYYMYVYMSQGDGYLPAIYITNDHADAEDFLDDFVIDDWMEILSEMEYDDDFTYLDDVFEDELVDVAEDHLDDSCDLYGCDEIVSLGLEIELDGADYLLCMDVACYDGKWYNLSPVGSIGTWLGISALSGGLCADYYY